MTLSYDYYGTPIYSYYDEEWRTETFTCRECGWSGTDEEMDGPNPYSDLFDCCCVKCDTIMLIVAYPTMEETIQAANSGNPEARQQLAFTGWKGGNLDAGDPSKNSH
jgi:hypothetical protein